MSNDDEWTKLLHDHPIFYVSESHDSHSKSQSRLELSTNTLPDFTKAEPDEDSLTPSGRRQVMILKDADLIVAIGKEVRMSSFGDLKLSKSVRQSYKTLHTPNIQFEICQISLNPSGKLLAVAGAYQVAVIVLPRVGYSRLVPDRIDCKAIQIGQFYHASKSSAPVARIQWHPWGEAGSTLLVMTVDGKLREYDVSDDTEEPQQVLSFVPEKKTNTFMAVDESEREVSSFTLGKGRADWGPLTVYAIMKSGDIYSMCPYMPQNASIPSAYIHSLECFISAKQEFLLQGTSSASKSLSSVYDYQHKYVSALIKQLPPGTAFPAISKNVPMHPPSTIKSPPLRQGPFLLQPAPRMLSSSEGGDATDIVYLAFGTENDDHESEVEDPEHLGVILVSYQDGKVDVFLDVDKVEARWDTKQTLHNELPMFCVYESIDLGLLNALRDLEETKNSPSPTELLRANHPVFLLDPLHDEFVYVYHAFGVHALDVSPVIQSLSDALQDENDNDSLLQQTLEKPITTDVRPILSTFSVERRSSNPVISAVVPNDVYLNYCILVLTSAMRVSSLSLDLRLEAEPTTKANTLGSSRTATSHQEKSKWLVPLEGNASYTSLLKEEPFKPPFSGVTSVKLSVPAPSYGSQELKLTPDSLRYLAKAGSEVQSQLTNVQIAWKSTLHHVAVQQTELSRQIATCKAIETSVEKLKGPNTRATDARFLAIQNEQKDLLARLDRLLQALMRQASPELSEHENKWFEELKRMKEEILGQGKYDEDSLVTRTRTLQKEYARILPSLLAMAGKEAKRAQKHSEATQSLGFSQAFEYGKRSNTDRTRIALIEKQLNNLATKIDVVLGPPPGASDQM